MDLITTRGIPASGKTTWATKWVAEDSSRRLRVNRDDLRQMLYNKPFGVDEEIISSVELAVVVAALRRGKSVVVDATHLHRQATTRWQSVAAKHRARFHIRDFDCSVETAIERDLLRPRTVGADVIQKMSAKREWLTS